MKRLALCLVLAACGGKSPDKTVPPAASQDLTASTARLCAAPTRAKADPDWAGDDPRDNLAVIGKHARDGVTNKRVLAFVDAWQSGSKSMPELRAQLDSLTHDADLSSRCRLLELFTPPQTQTIE